MRLFCFFCKFLLVAGFAHAKDFGVEGHTYVIAEESILSVIESRLAKIDIAKLNHELQEKTKGYVERPTAVKGITKAKEDKTFYFDPTFTLDHDIKDHNGKLIHQAGTQVNPLEHIPLKEDLVFIDGDDQLQVELALNTRLAKAGNVKIILVKGSPIGIQKEHKIWIYFDQGGVITRKLGITEIPAIVEQEGLKLRIKLVGEVNHE